jgi:hypothetical protein
VARPVLSRYCDPMRGEPVLRLRGGLVTRRFEAETVVLDLRSSSYLIINPTAEFIWQHLERGATREEIVAGLMSEFEVDPQRAARDTDSFVERCRSRGFLQEDEFPASEPE